MAIRLPSWLEWHGECELRALPAVAPPQQRPKREPPAWRPMRDLERRAALELGRCRLPPRSCTKRMVGNLVSQSHLDEPRITDKQAVYLWRFAWTYRRQIRDADVKEVAKQRRATECNAQEATARWSAPGSPVAARPAVRPATLDRRSGARSQTAEQLRRSTVNDTVACGRHFSIDTRGAPTALRMVTTCQLQNCTT